MKKIVFLVAALALAVPVSASARNFEPANDGGGGAMTVCIYGFWHGWNGGGWVSTGVRC
jgi:hypothetical protein